MCRVERCFQVDESGHSPACLHGIAAGQAFPAVSMQVMHRLQVFTALDVSRCGCIRDVQFTFT